MLKVYECVGRYAATPFTIKNTYIRVWCLEELCYYICENAALIDERFVSGELLEWLSDELGLTDLVKRLKQIRRQSVKLESLIGEILMEAHYVSEDELKLIGRVIRANRSQTSRDRKLVLADYFLKGGHYMSALKSYEELLQDGEEGSDRALRARILFNMAVIHARLFDFREAAELYADSYAFGGGDEALFGLLAAKRMITNDADYLAFLDSMPEALAVSGSVEKAITQAHADYSASAVEERIDELKQKRVGAVAEYEQRAQQLLFEEKQAYRRAMCE